MLSIFPYCVLQKLHRVTAAIADVKIKSNSLTANLLQIIYHNNNKYA